MMKVEKRDTERQRDEMPESYVYLYTYALEDRKKSHEPRTLIASRR